MLHWTTGAFLITRPPVQHVSLMTPPKIDFDTVDRIFHPIGSLLMVVTNVAVSADRRTMKLPQNAAVAVAITVDEVAAMSARTIFVLILLGGMSIARFLRRFD